MLADHLEWYTALMSLSLRQLACALACLIALGGSLPALGAQAAPRWHTFTSANGLAGNIVQAIWEDQRGQIWFGTEDGVSRYDGQRWVTFRAGPARPECLGRLGRRAGNLVRH